MHAINTAGTGVRSKGLILTAMIFAVAMTFIDQTIVSIAVPKIQSELHLSINTVQWVVNGYLLALAAMFAFGGRLHERGQQEAVVGGVGVDRGAQGDDADGLAALDQRRQLLGGEGAEARGEVAFGASFVEFYAEEAKRVYGETIPTHKKGGRIIVHKQPAGARGRP